MLTIEEAMNLPALAGTKLIAGEKGIDHPIKWVTTIEIIEDLTRFHDGEFVVTTGFGLTDNPKYKEKLIQLIKSKRLSGLAIYIGFYIKKIPSELMEEAHKQDLPLIEIPSTINFSTVTKAIVEQIGNKQMRLLEDSLTIHKEMTKLVLNNVGLNQMLLKISSITDSSLFVIDDMGELLASTNIHDNHLTIQSDLLILDDEVRNLALYLDLDQKDTRASKVQQWNNYFLFRLRITSGSFTYGYLVSFQEKKAWTEMDEIIMDHVATLVGIELVKQYAVEETKVRLQGELVEEILIKEKVNEDLSIKRGKRLGYDLTKTHAVLYIKIMIQEFDINEEESHWVNHLHYVVSQTLTKQRRQVIVLPKLNSLFVLVEVDMNEQIGEKIELITIAKTVNDRWSRHFTESLMIGIGNPYLGLQHLSQSAKESEYAVQYAPLLLKESSIVHFDDLGFYQILIRMQETGISLKLFYEKYLGNLIGNKQHRTDLILTLEMYLAQNCNIQQTASQLYVHRHTLKYRLSQIEKRTGLSLQSPDDRLNLHLAILAYKFIQLQKQHSF